MKNVSLDYLDLNDDDDEDDHDGDHDDADDHEMCNPQLRRKRKHTVICIL